MPFKRVFHALSVLSLISIAAFASEPAWGPSEKALRVGIALSVGLDRMVLVSFQNTGSRPMSLSIGGSTGNGPIYSMAFIATQTMGRSCRLANTMGGPGVAGYIAPIVLELAPASVRTIEIPMNRLVCLETPPSRGLEDLLSAGYSLKVSLKVDARNPASTRSTNSWTGAVESGTIPAKADNTSRTKGGGG